MSDNNKITDRAFFEQYAPELAVALLGKFLCVRHDDVIRRLMITETEAYVGKIDSACHAYRGKTKRNSVLYKEGGHAYVHLCYGIHYLINIVSGAADEPEGVLIRGLEGYNGPGKLTRVLGIDMSYNMENLINSNRLWLEDNGINPHYTAMKRIGINYAEQKDIDRLWRFVVK